MRFFDRKKNQIVVWIYRIFGAIDPELCDVL